MKKSNSKRKRTMKGKGPLATAAGIATLGAQAFRGNKRPSSSKTKTKSKKRKVSKGSAESGQAWKVTNVVRAKRTLRNVDRKLKRKIDAINDYDKPYGEYRYFSDQQIRQSQKDQYNIYYADNNGMLFDQFTPMQIWDAASVCFNGKTANPNYYAGVTQNWTANVRYKQTIHVVNSYTKFEFKSTSSHVINLEMYVCSPRNNAVSQPVPSAINNQTNAQNDQFYIQEINGSITGRSINFETDLGVKGTDWTSLHKDYLVECTKYKFQPGEHKIHYVQGPKMIDIDGTKYASGDGLTLQNYAKFAKFIFFRIINDATVCGVEGIQSSTECVARWPSNYQGGLAMRQMRSIHIRMPETTDINTNDIPAYAGTRQNQLHIGRFTRRSNYDTDQQVVVENPIGLASIFQ